MSEEKERKINRICAGIGGFLVISYALLLLADIWGANLLDEETFAKLTATYFILGVVLVLVFLLYREIGSEARMKKDKYLD